MVHSVSYYVWKNAIKSALYLAIYACFFKSNVRDYFGLTERRRWKDLLKEAGVYALMWLIASAGSALSGYG